MANQINITPASQVTTVEVNNRQLSVNVQNSIKTVEVMLEARSNIAVDISRSIALTGVQKIIAGTNITIDPLNGTGNVTINASDNVGTANYANYAGEAFSVNGSNVIGYVQDAVHANIADIANVAYSVAGANVVGNVQNANYANYAYYAGEAFLVSGANVDGAVLQAENATNAYIATYATTANSVAGANVSGYVANASFANVSEYASVANSVAGANVSGYVANATHANLADVADSVDVANVVGIGTVATVNLDYNAGNVLYGDGQWRTSGTAANAVYADFAGEAYLVSGSNVSGAVNLANYATVANSVAGANVSGSVLLADEANLVAGGNVSGPVANATHANVADSANTVAGANVTGSVPFADEATVATYATTANSVAVANVVGIGNIATINLNNEPDQALFGDGVWRTIDTGVPNYANYAGTAFSVAGSNVVGTVANANVAEFAGVVTNNAQPNITSVGILNGLQVSGSITPNSNIGYDLGNTTNRFRDIYLSGSTVYLGDETLTVTGGTFTFSSGVNAVGNITSQKFYAQPGADASHGYGFTGAANNDTAMCLTNTDEITIYNNALETLTLYANNNSKFYGNLEANLYNGDGYGLSNIFGPNVTGFVPNAVYANASDTATTATNLNGNLSGTLRTNSYSIVGASYDAAQLDLSLGASLSAVRSLAGPGGGVQIKTGTTETVTNIWTFDYDGNLTLPSNTFSINYANGTQVTIGNAENSNYANYAGEAFSVSGSNIIGEVANANYATYSGESYLVSGANVSGAVANATHAVHADEANSVSGSNVVGQVANALIAGTVYSNAQPNITSVGSLVSLDVDGDILGHANISGDYILGNGAFLTGVGNFSAARGYHGSFYSNVTQTITSTTTAYPITLNNTDPNSYGVSIQSNSQIKMTYAGTYNIQYSIQFTNTNNSIYNATVWLRKNGTDVPDTNSVYAITGSHGGTNGQSIGAINYIVTASANDYYQLIWQAENTSVSLEYIGPGTTPTSPATPSVIVTAMQVTNVQAATLGGNLTANLVGNSYGLTGVSFINITGNIEGGTFIGNAGGLTGLVGGNVIGYVANATHANIADAANVAYSVSGANVVGTVANANHAIHADEANSVTGGNVVGQVGNALISGTVYSNAQPNITSVGTLSSLSVTGNITSGNASLGNLTTSNYFSGNGSLLTSITGGNVIGAVPFASTANAVAGANVSGAVSFATTANSVAGANVSGAVSFATTANSVAGANVSGTVANATYAITAGVANSVAGSNVSGQVANALVAGTVYTNAQPNITSVGTLTSVTANGNINLQLANGAGTNGTIYMQSANTLWMTAGAGTVIVTANNESSISAKTYVSINTNVANGPTRTWTYYANGGLDGPASGFANLGNLVTANYFSGNGSLTSLNVSGVSNLNSVSNVIITGGTSGYVLSTNGSGNLSWVAQSGGGSSQTDFTPSFLLGGM